ncbi:MAG: glycosyl transferase family [Planctomycetota bacterium]|jgi:glycosyltransferase involved in cell wall biosynthesis
MRIAVCISTLDRHDGLARALRSVASQRFEGATAPAIEAIVANNDPTDRAPHEIARAIHDATGLAVTVLDEPERGTAPPRNRALAQAQASSDLIAFLDDDEEAPPEWLATMLAVKARFDADIVTGPVIPTFDRTPPEWAARAYARPARATGSPRPWAFTGNVLFDAALLERLASWFDPRFTQGEDRHFFARLAATGARIVWCAEAAPREYIPESRLDPAWHVRRMRAIGRAVTAIERDTPASALAAVRNTAKGVVWIAVGATRVACGLVLGEAQRVKGRGELAYGAGLIAGSIGAGRSSPRS